MIKRRIVRIALYAIAVFVVGFTGYVWMSYRDMYSPAHPTALAAMASDQHVTVQLDEWISFKPAVGSPTTGIIFYPGGILDEQGYSEPMKAIAQEGYLVVLVSMPLGLAVLSPNKAEEVIDAYPEIDKWLIGGHSLGGAIDARFDQRNDDKLDGLLLFDAYPPESVDLREFAGLVGWIHRADEAGKMPEYYERYLVQMPNDVRRYPIVGGTHINFGRFIPAERFRNATPSELPIEEQFERIAAAAADFLGQVQESRTP